MCQKQFVNLGLLLNGYHKCSMRTGINGRGYGNLEGLRVLNNDRVSWHLIGLGTESDLHSVHFHGNTLVKDGGRVDTIAVFPGTTATAIMTADNPGISLNVYDNVYLFTSVPAFLQLNQKVSNLIPYTKVPVSLIMEQMLNTSKRLMNRNYEM